MKVLNLTNLDVKTKVGKRCPYFEPNVTESTILQVDGVTVGFYIKDVSEVSDKLGTLLAIANKEFRSDNVPKSLLERSDVLKHLQENPNMSRKEAMSLGTVQMSTILGSVPPKAQFKRLYGNRSQVHKVKTAQTFVKAMLACGNEGERVIKKLAPNLHSTQVKAMEGVDKKWRFGNLYTSSISNYNISAPFHKDTGNVKGSVNIIYTKRHQSKGGCLNVPDYGLTFEQADNSMLVYPAWMNVHGVTPIVPLQEGGYRNSLIFYSLKAFIKKTDEQK